MPSSQTTQTQQSAVTNPYAPAVPLLNQVAGTAGGISTAQTPYQTQSLDDLWKEAQGIPNLTPQGSTAVKDSLTASTAPQQGMLSSSINNYLQNTNPIAQNTDMNPWDTPGFAAGITAINTPIQQQLESQFAGSGRDPTGSGGAYAKALGFGEAQADAPVVAAQYNANVGNNLAANTGQSNAVTSGTNAMTSDQMAALNQQLAGVQSGAGWLPGLATAKGTAENSAANAAYNTPWSNLAPAAQTAEGIGGMGGTSFGTGNSTTNTSAITNILGTLIGGAGLYGAISKSDARLKENIEPVGKLHDGQTVHEFSWKGDPQQTRHIGLLAQEVEKVRPDAVHTLGGVKHVDYHKATEGARRIGMLQLAA
jgi:hypothetical protein